MRRTRLLSARALPVSANHIDRLGAADYASDNALTKLLIAKRSASLPDGLVRDAILRGVDG